MYMRENKRKIVFILIIALSVISICITTYAHSGKTDASGGHKDNKNKSGLGSYHYHCGGHPAHLHTNGVCPYSSSSSSSKSSKSSSSSSSTKTTTTVSSTVAVTQIQINENIDSIEVGESKTLTATIIPSDATDKSVVWKSSDESIATVSATGEIVTKKSGTVDITASSSNGKTSTITLNIKEETKVEDGNIIQASTTSITNVINNTTTNNQTDSNPLGGAIAVALLGGGCYWGYKKYKK
jgi:uncharacterized protein YjdB